MNELKEIFSYFLLLSRPVFIIFVIIFLFCMVSRILLILGGSTPHAGVSFLGDLFLEIYDLIRYHNNFVCDCKKCGDCENCEECEHNCDCANCIRNDYTMLYMCEKCRYRNCQEKLKESDEN